MGYTLLVWNNKRKTGQKYIYTGSKIIDWTGSVVWGWSGNKMVHISWDEWLAFIEIWRRLGFEVYTPAKKN